MAVVIICCMILVGLIFIYGGWKRPYDEISSAPDIWILEILFVIMKNYLRFQQKNLCVSHLWFSGLFGPCFSFVY